MEVQENLEDVIPETIEITEEEESEPGNMQVNDEWSSDANQVPFAGDRFNHTGQTEFRSIHHEHGDNPRQLWRDTGVR